MKKVFYFVVFATLLLLSCQKENTSSLPNDKSFSFKATIEKLSSSTKAFINDSHQFIWANGDQIGIYVNDNEWNDKNQPFTLVGEGGSNSGSFNWNYGDFSNTNANVAFFPWMGDNNVGYVDGNYNVYYELLEHYGTDAEPIYASGKMLTPLVAQVVYNGGEYESIAFKHAGAAVKVTINNLPAGAHSIVMIADKQITGYYHINSADAGSAPMTVNAGAEDDSNDRIWLHFAPLDVESPYVFIFPVPAIDNPKLSFSIYDENDILVWSKKLKAQEESLENADILVMPELDITPYEKFNETSSDWTVIGTITGWADDIPMITDGTYCIANNVTFAEDGAFKIRKGRKWDVSYPASDYLVSAGTYDIIFKSDTYEVKVVDSKFQYPSVD